MQLPLKYRFEEIAGKSTCKIAISPDGRKFFVKSPRTLDNEPHGLEEIFSELLVDRILRVLNASDLELSLERVGFKPAIVSRYYEKNWSHKKQEQLNVANMHDVPLFLVVDVWVRQKDRGQNKNEHVGLRKLEAAPGNYRMIPLDNGHALLGKPGGYTGLDEDLTPEFVKSLFWSTLSFSKEELEIAIQKIKSLPIEDLAQEILNEILSAASWSTETQRHMEEHAKKIVKFLEIRRKKLPEVLILWWEQTYSEITPIIQPDVAGQTAVVAI